MKKKEKIGKRGKGLHIVPVLYFYCIENFHTPQLVQHITKVLYLICNHYTGPGGTPFFGGRDFSGKEDGGRFVFLFCVFLFFLSSIQRFFLETRSARIFFLQKNSILSDYCFFLVFFSF